VTVLVADGDEEQRATSEVLKEGQSTEVPQFPPPDPTQDYPEQADGDPAKWKEPVREADEYLGD
jgi:hypothetical protein